MLPVSLRPHRVRWFCLTLCFLTLIVLHAATPLWAQGPTIVIQSLSPNSAVAGGPPFTLTVTANGGVSAAMALRWNGAGALPPTSFGGTNISFAIPASYIANPGIATVQVCFSTFCSNTLTFTITPQVTPPRLDAVSPAVLSAGARQTQLTLVGSNFQRGARVVIANGCGVRPSPSSGPANVSVSNAVVVSDRMMYATVSVSPQAAACVHLVDVVNPDGASSATSGTSKTLALTPTSSLAAPLQATGIALISPRNGLLLAQGDELYAEAIVAGAGTGLVTGEWLWDGYVSEQFNVNLTGGQRATLRTNSPLPTALLGMHTVQLRITSPNVLVSDTVQLMINPGDWKTARLLAPRSGAGFRNDAPPSLQWTIMPGVAKYEVGFSTKPHFNSIDEWREVNDTQWQVPKEVWQKLPVGDLYWTVRSVEISKQAGRPLPMRRIAHLGADTLRPASGTPAVTSSGSLLLAWESLKQPAVYRITITRDAEGRDVLRRYLTNSPQCDLRAVQGLLRQGQTYFWQVEAFTLEGRTVITGERNSFVSPTGSQIRGKLFTFSTPMGGEADTQSILINRNPAQRETVHSDRPVIGAEFRAAVNPSQVAISLDDTDVTALAEVSDTKARLTSPLPLGNGSHEVEIALGTQSDSWTFNVAVKAAQAAAAQEMTDAEPPAPTTQAAADTLPAAGPQFRTQVGVTPQLFQNGPKTLSMNVGEQMTFQQGNWRAELNGSGLFNTLLSPEPRYTVGRFNDYVGRVAYDVKSFGLASRFGVVAPSLFTDAEFVGLATPREGVEATMRTPAGSVGFFANTNDASLGGGQTSLFHQNIRGASYEAPLPSSIARFRLMWMSAQDVASQPATFVDPSGTTTTAVDTLGRPGKSDTYGGLLQIHLGPQWLWTSEYAWSLWSPDSGQHTAREFGRAWRSGVTGTMSSTTVVANFRDVSPLFGSVVNPGLTQFSTADRRGVEAAVTQRSKVGNFTVGYQFQQSGVHQVDRPTLNLHNFTGGWSIGVHTGTTVALQGHAVRTTTEDLGTPSLNTPTEELLALRANLRDVGFTASVVQQVGRTLQVTASGSRSWVRNGLLPQQSAITSGMQFGGTWKASSFFQLQANVGHNWSAQDALTLGWQRMRSIYLQPMFTWQRTGLSLVPIVSYADGKGHLGNGTQTQDSMSSQAGGRVMWKLPSALHFGSFGFEGTWVRMRNGVVATGLPVSNLTDKRIAFLLTVVGNYDRAGL